MNTVVHNTRPLDEPFITQDSKAKLAFLLLFTGLIYSGSNVPGQWPMLYIYIYITMVKVRLFCWWCCVCCIVLLTLCIIILRARHDHNKIAP